MVQNQRPQWSNGCYNQKGTPASENPKHPIIHK